MIEGKRILMIIASKDFRDEELFRTMEVIEKNGGKVTVASTTLEPITGMLGATATAEVLLSNVDVEDYDAIVFVGGLGSQQYFNDATAHSVAMKTVEQGKVLGAICIAPSTLANAGLLKGVKATCYESERQNLIRNGAQYTGNSVTTDGDIVTGNGPEAAKEFGKALVDRLAAK